MFLHPWIVALGAAAAVLPVAIHFLTRPKPTRLALSTIRFVREAVNQRRARHWLRDFLVLALRTAAVVLLAAAIARPFFGGSREPVLDDSAKVVRVVLLDVSQSMAAQSKGITSLDRGRPIAAQELQFRQELRANLLLAAAQPQAVFASASTNFSALRDALATAAALPQRLNVQPAIDLAGEMLSAEGAADARRELVVVSDFQRNNWATANFDSLPQGTVIRLESAAPAEGAGNFAITRVGLAGRAESGQEVRLEADVGNFTAAAATVRAEVRLGEASYQLSGTCPPLVKTTLTTTIRAGAAGWQLGEARLVGIEDALAADNVRPCAFEVVPPPTYAFITSEPEQRKPSSTYYLERALAPVEATDPASRKRIVRVDPEQLDRQSLAAADLVLIDHPGQLSAESIAILASMLKRGRGMLYVAAEPVDAANLKLLTDAVGPVLKLPVEFAPVPVGQDRRHLFLGQVQRDAPLFAMFGDQLSGLTGPLRFSGGLVSRSQAGGLADDVLAAYSDGSACLVMTTGQGASLAVLNADLEQSNLPTSPLFVPLVGEITRILVAGKQAGGEQPSGEPLSIALPGKVDRADELAVQGPPTSAGDRGELTQEPLGIVWRSPAAAAPGVYQVKRAGETIFALATVIPDEEADLRSLSADVFQTRLAGQRDIRFRAYSAGQTPERDRLWTWLAVACAACVLGEFVALRLFRT